MAGRIVLFGATGFTGRLVAAALVRRGALPLLAGRRGEQLAALTGELGGHLDVAVADTADAASLARLVGRGDVLVTTVGPFLRHGDAAVRAATSAGATYLDSTGEPPFLRRLFAAPAGGTALLPAFGYDYVPGNLAAALALREAGTSCPRVDVGYFVRGGFRTSGGTAASARGVLLEPGYAWRGGRLRTERPAARTRSFAIGPRRCPALSIGGSEHLALPRTFPALRDVGVYLGWGGRATPLLAAGSAALSVGPIRRGVAAILDRLPSRGDPSPTARASVRSLVVAEAGGARVAVEGPDPYDLTGELLAEAAVRAVSGGVRGTGTLGPVEAFGLEELERICTAGGLTRVAA